jgi:hypothetical protein
MKIPAGSPAGNAKTHTLRRRQRYLLDIAIFLPGPTSELPSTRRATGHTFDGRGGALSSNPRRRVRSAGLKPDEF